MPRQPRHDAPGVIHHVWARGIDGRTIFLDDSDREDLWRRFSRILPESGMRCFATILMSNHLHLVVQTGPISLSTVMRRIHTGFAMRFNGRAQRAGYLFQGRFGSRIVGDDGDFLRTVAYVLRNPIAAGLVSDLNELARQPWCSFGALMGRRAPLPFESTVAALGLLGPDPETARRRLCEWILRTEASRDPLWELVDEVCRELGVAVEDLRGGRRDRCTSEARGRICRRAVLELRLRPSAVGRALGVGPSTVSQALRPRS
jgi:REP element-mobilizing transposase RayT